MGEKRTVSGMNESFSVSLLFMKEAATKTIMGFKTGR